MKPLHEVAAYAVRRFKDAGECGDTKAYLDSLEAAEEVRKRCSFLLKSIEHIKDFTREVSK